MGDKRINKAQMFVHRDFRELVKAQSALKGKSILEYTYDLSREAKRKDLKNRRGMDFDFSLF